MEFREGLLYSKMHEWVKEEEGCVLVGLTDYAQSKLGEIVFIDLPCEGDEIVAGEAFAKIEAVEEAADLFSPVSGIVCEINEELLDSPETINEEPYESWFIKVKDISDKKELLSVEEYMELVEKI